MKDLVQCTVSRDDFQRWLYWGKTPLTIYKGEEAVTMLLKIEKRPVDYLYQTAVEADGSISWRNGLTFCGVHDIGKKTLYLSESLTTILIDGQAPFASKTIPSVVDEICGRINQCVEETIANDRNNLSVQEVTSWQAARELKEYLEDGAHREAIDWFFRGSEPDGQFHSGYTLGNLPEATFMAWLQDPEGLVQTEADQHIKINQEKFLLQFLKNDALVAEYQAILDMYENTKVTIPIKAFFGDLLDRPRRYKAYPITLIDKRINLDQLLAINNGMKNPVTYIQGPPGTGKTSTIINTIITAFFNGKTVLFCSYNNHPINGVFDKLSNILYRNKRIPFPVLRLGNQEKEKEALQYMKQLYEAHKNATIFEGTLDKNRELRTERARRLSELLKKYEYELDLHDRDEALSSLLEYEKKNIKNPVMIPFQADLQERQLSQIKKKIKETGEIKEEDVLPLLDDNIEDLKKYLYYTSEKYIKKIGAAQNEELFDIIYEEDESTQLGAFKRYLSNRDNIKKLQKIFPVIITTCISAHKIGEPSPMFDMVIMDEASQCNTAVSLVPIIRGENLVLVGDPQQLNPVILLNEMVNEKLRRKYNVTDEYDYRKNSIYKTFLACDCVSDEILLHHHYRCNKKIINFNNRKYYNSKLSIASENTEEKPLVYVNVSTDGTDKKNTSSAEVNEIVKYASHNRDKSIGVITPFVNQKKMIEEALDKAGLTQVTCGTIHAFQGDEKDVILFSTAITEQTGAGTYEWLKNNKEMINVATSRAKDKLILLSDMKNLQRLHREDSEDDLYELVKYVRANGESKITPKVSNSRALGIKPYSTVTEEAFLKNLNHALENIWMSQSQYTVEKEVAISQVFRDNTGYNDLFYTGRFDFVVYEKQGNSLKLPILAIELDGKEHYENDIVMERDRKKNAICREHDLQLIRVENSYARRYNHIKEILIDYFGRWH